MCPSARPLTLLGAVVCLLAGAAPAAEDARVVSLPPFIVDEPAQPLRWRYAKAADWEVLSTCSDRLTRTLIANHHRLDALLAELLPPSLQLRVAQQTLLFVDSAHQPPTSPEVVAAMALTAAEQDRLETAFAPPDDGRLRRRLPPLRYAFLPNLRLWDRDMGALLVVVQEKQFDPNRVALTPDYVAYLLRQRVPALPPWFVSGVLTLFSRARATDDALVVEPIDWPPEIGGAALLSGSAANRAPMSLADFFAGELASADPADPAARDALALWQAQAALLVRWGVAGPGAPRRAALWKFVARAAVEPVTPALFQACFGIDYETARRQLTAFVSEATSERLVLRPAQRPAPPEYALRDATETEIACLKGEWERLEIGYVKAQFPMLASRYQEQARRTLRRGYNRDPRDPRLLAALGLCEVDSGDDAAARPLLESAFAAAGATLRPRVGIELARLRLAARRAAGTLLTAGQAAEVRAPLLAARAQPPPLPERYELLAELDLAVAEPPDPADRAALEEGVRLFPRRSELVHRAAELNLRHGFNDTARWLVTLGLTLAPDAETRARFEALQARIPAR